jgi:hypothetical protein
MTFCGAPLTLLRDRLSSQVSFISVRDKVRFSVMIILPNFGGALFSGLHPSRLGSGCALLTRLDLTAPLGLPAGLGRASPSLPPLGARRAKRGNPRARAALRACGSCSVPAGLDSSPCFHSLRSENRGPPHRPRGFAPLAQGLPRFAWRAGFAPT